MAEDIKIGLETHLQLLSDSKLFCGCPTSGSDEPNSRVCPTCLGMPGSKPRVNKKVVEMGMKIAEALNCELPQEMNFSRKSYFYPDMPKNFQITQYSIPLGKDGNLELNLDGEKREVRIRRIHLEEDPGKIKHVGGGITSADYVLLDYNRSGVPLCEIVTEPDLKSPKEARIFLRKLANIFEYLGVYDSTSEASIRSDANVSTHGERTEVKNITGFRGIEKALRYEVERQKNLRKRGKEVVLETRAYDDKSGVTKSLRKKEIEEEYGYIFEPDLTRIELTQKWVNEVTEDLPELPHKKRKRYMEQFELSEEVAETICSDLELAKAFEKLLAGHNFDIVSRIVSGPVKKVLNYNDLRFSESELDLEKLEKIVGMLESEQITERNAEMLLREMVTKEVDPEKLKEEMGLGKVPAGEIQEDVKEVIDEEEEAVEDYKEGREEALNFLVGKVMKRVESRADPKEVRELLKRELDRAEKDAS